MKITEDEMWTLISIVLIFSCSIGFIAYRIIEQLSRIL